HVRISYILTLISVISKRITFSFFFSSRRRHTRSKRDWSSDVCSSDLPFQERCLLPAVRSAPLVFHPSLDSHCCQTVRQEPFSARSEERRVGKEWSSRWGLDH